MVISIHQTFDRFHGSKNKNQVEMLETFNRFISLTKIEVVYFCIRLHLSRGISREGNKSI